MCKRITVTESAIKSDKNKQKQILRTLSCENSINSRRQKNRVSEILFFSVLAVNMKLEKKRKKSDCNY